MANRPSVFNNEFFDAGVPAAGYKLYTYESGTTTPKATYTDQAGTIPNTNPITLDADGRCELWLGSGEYTVALYTRAIGDGGALVMSRDDVSGAATSGELTTGLALIRSDFASTASGKGAALIGYLRSAFQAVATTLYRWLNWQDFDPFEFMTEAQIADVQAGTALLDVAVPWQACITAAAGRPIRMRGGTHRIGTALTYTTSGYAPGLKIIGDGSRKSIFDNRVANGTMLTLDGTGTPSEFADGARLKGFSIIHGAATANSRGIDIKSQWYMDVEDVPIFGMSSDAVRIINLNGDADSSSYLTFTNYRAQSNGGWGLLMTPSTLSSENSGPLTLDKSYFTSNVAGGASLLGLDIEVKHTTFAYNTGAGGLVFPYDATSTSVTSFGVYQCDFDDNTGYHIDVQAAKQGEVHGSKLIYRANMVGIRIGDGGAGSALNVDCYKNQHLRVAGTVTAHSVGSNANYCNIEDNYYPTLTGVTKVANTGLNTVIDQDNQMFGAAVGTNSTAGAGPFTIDHLTGDFQRLVVNAAGAFTINSPTAARDGACLELEINNSSGGVITATFDAAFQHAGYADPANGKLRTATFRYYATSTRWKLIGAWSPDI